jgi:hypothetical protein
MLKFTHFLDNMAEQGKTDENHGNLEQLEFPLLSSIKPVQNLKATISKKQAMCIPMNMNIAHQHMATSVMNVGKFKNLPLLKATTDTSHKMGQND